MKQMWKRVLIVSGALMLTLALAAPAFADEPAQAGPAAAVDAVEDQGEGMTTGMKAIAVALAIGIAAGGGGLGILPGLLFRFLPGLFLGFLFGLRFLLGLGLRLLVRLVLCGRGGRGGFRRGGLVFRIRGGAEGRGEDQAEKARRHEEGGAGPEKAGGKA